MQKLFALNEAFHVCWTFKHAKWQAKNWYRITTRASEQSNSPQFISPSIEWRLLSETYNRFLESSFNLARTPHQRYVWIVARLNSIHEKLEIEHRALQISNFETFEQNFPQTNLTLMRVVILWFERYQSKLCNNFSGVWFDGSIQSISTSSLHPLRTSTAVTFHTLIGS